MSDDASGASRRDLLRGSAIGVGALVGAMALTNAQEVSADAATSVPHTYYVTMSGINPTTKIKLISVSFGGENDGGTLSAALVSLTMDSGQFSPLILQAMALKTVITKATILGYQPDVVTGKTVNSLKITCNSARVMYYHLAVSSSGAPVDTVRLSFTSVDLDWVLQNRHFTWTPPPAP
jgi:type VI protein secretion system component Hcp